MRERSIWVICALLAAGLVFGGGSAPAGAQGSFGIAGGIYEPDEEGLDRTEVFGVRGGYRINPSFGVEAALSQVDLLDEELEPFADFGFDFEVDLYNLDLSAQWFPRGGDFVVFGGPGVARLDSDLTVTTIGGTFSESDTTDIFTAHAGVAYQWQATERFFLRPEVRVRRYFDDEPSVSEEGPVDLDISYEATDYEASVVLGWRFGS